MLIGVGGKIPPANLPSGYSITINGNCILDITQQIQTGATLTVAAEKSLLILGSPQHTIELKARTAALLTKNIKGQKNK
ncbi:MAG: hypothetical protein H7Z13_21420 [Ferruginibacter sp.]|nr:hypothetical protein [Ferruginibacter sp.]